VHARLTRACGAPWRGSDGDARIDVARAGDKLTTLKRAWGNSQRTTKRTTVVLTFWRASARLRSNCTNTAPFESPRSVDVPTVLVNSASIPGEACFEAYVALTPAPR